MNLTGKHLLRFWAAFNSDIEVLQGKFLSDSSFLFEVFCNHAREMKFMLALNTTIGKGKFKDEHYTVMMTLMLDCARNAWLCEGNTVNTVSPKNPLVQQLEDDILILKRRIFGCYLLYSLWINQPFIDDPRLRVLIKMSAENILKLLKFVEDYKDNAQLEAVVRLGLAAIISTFKTKSAFQYTIDSNEYGVELWKRVLLTAQRSRLTLKTFEMRDVQDSLVHSTACRNSGDSLLKMHSNKTVLKELLGQSIIRNVYNTLQGSQQGALRVLKVSKSMNEVTILNESVKDIAKYPIITIEQLTAQETAPRIILAETRRRMQRSRKRLLDEPKEAKSPYVGQGGTFGRRKDAGFREGGEKRERGMCSGNLWTYISGNSFDRPLGFVSDDATAGKVSDVQPEPPNAVS